MSDQVKATIKEVFEDIATALETGEMGQRIKIGLTINGSENGFEVMKEAARIIQQEHLFDLVLIGEKQDWTDGFEVYEASCEKDVTDKLDELLANGTIAGAVTLHHPFPIGVSTVGRVIAPAFGKEVFIATTTGTTAIVRNEAMVLNAINGIAAAKACGIEEPTVGILNVDGSNAVERALRQLSDKGYKIHFAESARKDGGVILRGNDLIMGSANVVVCDTLTGNILMKLFGAAQSGGNYETTGYGYGPSIGDGYDKIINIVSRASGAPVIANALRYCYQAVKGKAGEIAKAEYAAAKAAGLEEIRESLQPKAANVEAVKAPAKEVVTASLSGIDVLDLEDAVKALWKEGIYAESGMGCSGPVILVSEANADKARQAVVAAGFM